MTLRVAYFIDQYPMVSHSFIRREILALERRGVLVQRIAARGWLADLVDEEDLLERTQTHYLLRRGALGLLGPTLRALFSAPLRFMVALRLAVRMARRADRPLPYHLAYLGEACCALFLLRDFGATHLHAHFGANPAEVALLVHALGGPPFSFTVHGPEEFDKPHLLHLQLKIQHASFVVAVSSFGRSQLFRWAEPMHWPKLKVVHCGLDSTFLNDTGAAPQRAPRLVCVGRLCEQKGQLLLLEAAAKLVRMGVAFELVLAGDGDMRPPIEAAIARLQLATVVRVTGWLSGPQVRQEILAARALVLPSFAEGLPVVIMEALALRRPVVTTLIAGIPELVQAGENGWLVPAGDVDELVQALQACLAATPEQLAGMGERGRAHVLERHNADMEAAKLVALFAPAELQG